MRLVTAGILCTTSCQLPHSLKLFTCTHTLKKMTQVAKQQQPNPQISTSGLLNPVPPVVNNMHFLLYIIKQITTFCLYIKIKKYIYSGAAQSSVASDNKRIKKVTLRTVIKIAATICQPKRAAMVKYTDSFLRSFPQDLGVFLQYLWSFFTLPAHIKNIHKNTRFKNRQHKGWCVFLWLGLKATRTSSRRGRMKGM